MNTLRDIQYALRLLGKSPGFTVLTTLVMACGIGLSVYLFSFMHTMIFKPFPFQDGESLMRISVTENGQVGRRMNLHDIEQIRAELQGVSEFTRYRRSMVNVSGRDGARQFIAYQVDQGFHGLTRIQPLLGRDFVRDDMARGALDVAVISHEVWQNQFAGRTDIIGQSIRINGSNHEVVGVMPEAYQFPDYADIWLPMREDAAQLERGEGPGAIVSYHMLPGYSKDQINAQLQQIMARLEQQYPKTNTGVGARTHTIQMSNAEGGRPVVYALHVAAILILILASVNVGNLLLTRANERGKETAIRVALGAPRYRLVSQMLWESIIICFVGAFIGLMMLGWGLEVTAGIVGAFFAAGSPFWWQFGIDAYTAKLFVGFLLFTIIVTGLVPAWKNSGGDFNSVLRDGTRGALGKKAGRMNKLLVISEIFLSVTILILASVFMISAWKSANGSFGAETNGLMRAKIELSNNDYPTAAEKVAFMQSLQSRLQESTLVGKVVYADSLPADFASTSGLEVKGMEYSQGTNASLPRIHSIASSVNMLQDMQVELVAGRFLDASDQGLEKATVVVTESAVEQFFPGGQAVGQQIRLNPANSEASPWLTVVGVVRHVVHSDQTHNHAARIPSVYRPYSQTPGNRITLAFERKTDAVASSNILRSVLQGLDIDMAPYDIETYEGYISRRNGPMSFISNVFMMFGLAALVLAASGIYGVMSNTINQRVQEIGIKRALGAWDGRITNEFLRSGLVQLALGAVPGLLVGGGLGYAMALATGSSQTDVFFISAGITLVLGAVVMAATIIPVRQALEFEPAAALHYE